MPPIAWGHLNRGRDLVPAGRPDGARHRRRSSFSRERQNRDTLMREDPDMSAFLVELKNQPGDLAGLCEAMAARGVNLVLCATTHGDAGTVAFIADDEASARAVLEGAGIEFAERPAVSVRMDNRPGAAAATFRGLASANVNVDLLLPVRISDELFFAVICVDDVDAARAVLGDQVVD
jgi:hypothetical protein